MCTSGGSSGGYSPPSYGGSGGYGQPMQQSYGGPYGGFPGWGRPFSYSPNAGPAYQRPQWPGSLPDSYHPVPPTTPGGGGTPPPPPPGAGGQDTRPPGTGAPTPVPPPYTGTDTRVTRPVNQPTWGAPQPYTNFPQFTQPGNLNSVGPGGPQPNTGTNLPNTGTTPNTPPAQPPIQTRPPVGSVPKIGMQGQLISDNFDGTPFGQQSLGGVTTSGVGMRDPNDNSPNLPQYAIGTPPPGATPNGTAPAGIYQAEATGNGSGFTPQQINQYGAGGTSYNPTLNALGGMNSSQLNTLQSRYATPNLWQSAYGNYNPYQGSWGSLLGMLGQGR